MIDICGTPPEGTGMQNLRKAIIQMKYKWAFFYKQNEKQEVSNDSVLEAVRIFSRTPHKDKDGRMCWREGKKVDQVH